MAKITTAKTHTSGIWFGIDYAIWYNSLLFVSGDGIIIYKYKVYFWGRYNEETN